MQRCNIHPEGGQLWQWDTDRRAHVLDYEEGDLLDLAGRDDCDALTVEVSEDGYAPIPNALLKRPGYIRCWLRRGNATVAAGSLKVAERDKPADYHYVETPTVGYAQLKARVEELDELVTHSVVITWATDGDIDDLYGKGGTSRE